MKLKLLSAIASSSGLVLVVMVGAAGAPAEARSNEGAPVVAVTCVACVESAMKSCTRQLDRCLGDPGCELAALCVQDCRDRACIERCEALADRGADRFVALKACALCSPCAGACGAAAVGCE